MNTLFNLRDLPNEEQAGQKKPYHTPKVLRYGALADLVQIRPNRGRDGETRWIDCTSG